MATKLYATNNASDVNPGAEDERASSLTQPTTGTSTATVTTVLGATAGIQLQRAGTAVCWMSPPLAAVVISGTVTFNICGLESNMSANSGFQVLVERCDTKGVVISTICNSEFGTELGTSASANSWTVAPTSRTLVDGDRIKFTILANDAGGTMAASFTVTANYNGNTAGTNDTWVQFNETVILAIEAPAWLAKPAMNPRIRV